MLDLELQVAYQVANDPQRRTLESLYRASDRLFHDFQEINEDSRETRRAAIQAIAVELDRRKVPVSVRKSYYP